MLTVFQKVIFLLNIFLNHIPAGLVGENKARFCVAIDSVRIHYVNVKIR